MSDNLEVAKECGAASVGCYVAAFHTTEELDDYTSRILASQQAAHEAEIAKLKEEVERIKPASLDAWIDASAKKTIEILTDQLSAANAACAMKDEALKTAAADLRGYDNYAAAEFAEQAISASPQQVSEWERKQLEPLRAQVAEQQGQIAVLLNLLGQCHPHSTEFAVNLRDATERYQATAEQFIAECEQRGAVKALEEYANDWDTDTDFNGKWIAEEMRKDAAKLNATSKKAG